MNTTEITEILKATSVSVKDTDKMIENMLYVPQVDCNVIHRFGPGIYIREVTIPAGTFAVGHYQKEEHTNIVLKGRVSVLNDMGQLEDIVAPYIYVGKPGRKIGYVHEDIVWQNIYATNERDVEKLEQRFLEKIDVYGKYKDLYNEIAREEHKSDLDDFALLLKELTITKEEIQKDMDGVEVIDLPYGSYKVQLGDSEIEGKGLFATSDILPNEIIAPARINMQKTIVGRYTNHSPLPNAKVETTGNGDAYLVASSYILGCHGGNLGDEITVDYRQALMHRTKEVM